MIHSNIAYCISWEYKHVFQLKHYYVLYYILLEYQQDNYYFYS